MPVEALLLPLRMPLFCSFEIIALVGCGIEASVSFFASGGPISSRSGEDDSALPSAELSLSVTWRKHERAVEDAGPYGVRERGHGRANRGTDPSPYGVCPSGCAGE